MPEDESLRITSVSSVFEIEKLYGFGKKLWFRGQANADQRLIPGAFRNPDYIDDEQAMLDEFKQDAMLRADCKEEGDWGWMVLAQHYGVPTRLLDWSLNPLQALYFAVEKEGELDGRLYVLEPTALNSKSVGSGASFPIMLEENNDRLEDYRIGRMTGSNCLPVAVIAYNDFPRIGAQRGVFTLFPERRSAITDDTLEGTCRSFVIPREHKEKILRELKFVCIDEYSSYPDLDHLGKRIAYSHMRSKTSL